MSRELFWFSLLLLAGCASAPPPPAAPPAAPAAAAVEEAATLSNDLHWTRSSAEHRALFVQTFRLAAARAGGLAAGRAPGAWAVAVDADETLLDNSEYQRWLLESGERFSEESWGLWVRRRAAPALPGAAAFLAAVREKGGSIAVVTNRLQEHCPATRDNLEAVGLVFDVLLCRTDSRDKTARWAAVEAGTVAPGLPPAEILLWVGDNIEDFPGGDQALRAAPEVDLAAFGDRFFLLPNPMYGSWVENPPG